MALKSHFFSLHRPKNIPNWSVFILRLWNGKRLVGKWHVLRRLMWLDKWGAVFSFSRLGPPVQLNGSDGFWLTCGLEAEQKSFFNSKDFISMLFSDIMMEKSRDFYLSVCAVLGLLLLPIHITADEYNSLMRVNIIFHWRLPTRATFPQSGAELLLFQTAQSLEKVQFGSKTLQIVWIMDVSVLCNWVCVKKHNQSLLDMRDASNSHRPSLISVSLSNLQYNYNYSKSSHLFTTKKYNCRNTCKTVQNRERPEHCKI